MGIFSRKKKKNKEIDKIAARYDPLLVEDTEIVDRKAVVGSLCERITKSVITYDETKKEYDVITSYLLDIEHIEKALTFKKIQEVAHQCQKLIQSRKTYLDQERKITDVQFVHFQELEEEIPLAINRLKDNEDEQTRIKRDLDILEGEKIAWEDRRQMLRHKDKNIRTLAIVVLASFVLFMVLGLLIQLVTQFNMEGSMLVVMILGVIGGFWVYVSKLNNQLMEKRAVVNRNHVVQLMNKVKIKYVSVKNAIDFAQEMYHVKNSYDFTYQWEEYGKRIKDLKRMTKNSDDLDIYMAKLEHLLAPLNLYDTKIWNTQTVALDNSKEMVEIKHGYLVERQKLRVRMEIMIGELNEAKDEIRKMTAKDDEYRQELMRIVRMIDQIGG